MTAIFFVSKARPADRRTRSVKNELAEPWNGPYIGTYVKIPSRRLGYSFSDGDLPAAVREVEVGVAVERLVLRAVSRPRGRLSGSIDRMPGPGAVHELVGQAERPVRVDLEPAAPDERPLGP